MHPFQKRTSNMAAIYQSYVGLSESKVVISCTITFSSSQTGLELGKLMISHWTIETSLEWKLRPHHYDIWIQFFIFSVCIEWFACQKCLRLAYRTFRYIRWTTLKIENSSEDTLPVNISMSVIPNKTLPNFILRQERSASICPLIALYISY